MSNLSIEKAKQAERILMTERNLKVSLDWLRNAANIDAPTPEDFARRCLHAG